MAIFGVAINLTCMKQDIYSLLSDLRERNPLIQNITNFVVMNNTANALLAIGASPMMVHGHLEAESSVEIASALVINVGTLDDYWAASMLLAAKRANEVKKPWILDPVGAGLSTFRNDVLEELVRLQPTVIRGNASEILALANHSSKGKGVDSTDASEVAINAARWLNESCGAVVCISGETDYIVDKNRIVAVKNGAAMMTKVTGLGCSSTAIVGGFIALNQDPFMEAVAGVSLFSLAGQLANEQAKGPGSLQMELCDALYNLNEQQVLTQLLVEEVHGIG